jgi:hypothetical protein
MSVASASTATDWVDIVAVALILVGCLALRASLIRPGGPRKGALSYRAVERQPAAGQPVDDGPLPAPVVAPRPSVRLVHTRGRE